MIHKPAEKAPRPWRERGAAVKRLSRFYRCRPAITSPSAQKRFPRRDRTRPMPATRQEACT